MAKVSSVPEGNERGGRPAPLAQQLTLGQALDSQGRCCDAQFLSQGPQGLFPALLVVQVEDTWGPAPILNCPGDQLRDQHLQALSTETDWSKECTQDAHGEASLHSLKPFHHDLS